jgi:hypothetical protein
MKLSPCLVAALLVSAAPARAEQWGVGAVAMPKPALSMQWQPDARSAWHLATHYDEAQIMADADYQRFWRLSAVSGRETTTALYSGLGLRGRSVKDEHATESYSLRLPVGVQASLRSLHMNLFVEGAGLLGALPGTRLTTTYSGGLRALF